MPARCLSSIRPKSRYTAIAWLACALNRIGPWIGTLGPAAFARRSADPTVGCAARIRARRTSPIRSCWSPLAISGTPGASAAESPARPPMRRGSAWWAPVSSDGRWNGITCRWPTARFRGGRAQGREGCWTAKSKPSSKPAKQLPIPFRKPGMARLAAASAWSRLDFGANRLEPAPSVLHSSAASQSAFSSEGRFLDKGLRRVQRMASPQPVRFLLSVPAAQESAGTPPQTCRGFGGTSRQPAQTADSSMRGLWRVPTNRSKCNCTETLSVGFAAPGSSSGPASQPRRAGSRPSALDS